MATQKKHFHSNEILRPDPLAYRGEKKVDGVKIMLIDYDENKFQEREVKNIEECFPFKDTPTVTWVNIDGLQDVGLVERIGKEFNIHPLVLEDILMVGQRPKYQDFEQYVFVALKMLMLNEDGTEINSEQVSLIINSNFVISFQETIGDVFNPIREHLRNAKGRIRKEGADYLAYSLIDTIVDNYFTILEKIGADVESIEEELVTNPNPKTLQIIHDLKRQSISLRKSVWPLREIINGLERGETPFIKKTTRLYLRDVYDHTIQVIDTVESLRDMISGMLEVYISSMNIRLNEIMKVLTIIATIFIPITFVASLYGMNFKYMPEISWRWGYWGALGVMAVIAILMLIYFRRKRWI